MATVVLVLIGIFIILLEGREILPKLEREVLTSVAHEFRRGGSQERGRVTNPTVFLRRSAADDELNGVIERVFEPDGALSSVAREELQQIAEELRSSRATLDVVYYIPQDRLAELSSFEKKAVSIQRIVAGDAPFLVNVELRFGEYERITLNFRRQAERVRWS